MFRSYSLNRETAITDLFRAIVGIVLTAMAAPLILSAIVFGKLAVAYPVAPFIIAASVMVGLSVSSAAALINAAIVSVLAWFRADALPISLASGGLVGLWARAVVVQKELASGRKPGPRVCMSSFHSQRQAQRWAASTGLLQFCRRGAGGWRKNRPNIEIVTKQHKMPVNENATAAFPGTVAFLRTE